jgi:pimeloyl-ACP methyl ester carboxylesterase
VVIQGDKDKLVPKENADFLKTNLSNAPMEMMRLPEQGHFLPWLEYDLVKAEILKAAAAHQGCAS